MSEVGIGKEEQKICRMGNQPAPQHKVATIIMDT